MQVQEVLEKTLQANQDKYINRLIELVRLDTHDMGHGIDGGLEHNGQEYLARLFHELGATQVEKDRLSEEVIKECKVKYHEGNLGHNYDNRYNVYATFQGGAGRSVLFNGHVDTMPADYDSWHYPPLQPAIHNDKLYGLGVCDMKAGLMAAVMAVELLKDAKIDLPGDVKIASVCDEEGGGNGSLVAAMNGVKADAVIVCEPTNYELIAAHMGWVFFKVEIEGIAVHSGLKIAGVSAIEKAIKIISALNELEHTWLLTYKHRLLPQPSGNVGVISGGEAGSTVPDYCCFQTCVHYLPGVMSYQQVVDDYTRAIMCRCDGDAWLKDHRPKITVYQAGNPFEMDLKHPLVDCFQQAYQEIIGHEVKIVGSPAGCDSRTWYNIAKCPTLQYGPGTLEQCHAVDEFVAVKQYLDAIKIYANLILNWCQERS